MAFAGMSGGPIASLFVKVGADISGFEQGMGRVEQRTSRTGRLLKGFVGGAAKVAVGLGVLGGAAAGAGFKLLNMGSDAEEMMAKFGTVFGEVAGQTQQALDDMAISMNRNRFDLRKFGSEFQDTFVPLGFARDEAAKMSTQLVGLTEDLSSFNNVSDSQVFQDLQSAIVGNHETMRKYGVIITQAALDQALLNMGIEGGVKAATEQQKVLARMNLIMQGTTDAQGDAVRTAGSWANVMRGLKATISETATAMGTELLPVATPLLQRFSEMVKTVAPQAISRFKDVVSFIASPGVATTVRRLVDGFKGLGSTLSRVSRPIKEAIGGLFTRLQAASAQGGGRGLFRQLGSELQGAGTALVQWLGSTGLPALMDKLDEWGGAFLQWASGLWDDKVLPGLAGLWRRLTSWVTDPAKRGQVLGLLQAGWGFFKDWAGQVWASAELRLADAWERLKRWVMDPGKRQRALALLQDVWSFFKDWAGRQWSSLGEKLGDLWQRFTAWVTDPTRLKILEIKLRLRWQLFKSWAADIWSEVKPELKTFSDNLGSWISDNAPGLQPWTDAFDGFVTDVKNTWALRWPEITERLTTAKNNIVDDLIAIEEAFQRIFGGKGAEGTVGFSIGKFLVQAGVGLVDVWSQVAERFVDNIRIIVLAVEQLINAFKAVWQERDLDKAWEAVKRAGELIGEAIKGSFWDLPLGMIDAWKRTFGILQDAVPSSGSGNSPTPPIPPGGSGGFGSSSMQNSVSFGDINITVQGQGAGNERQMAQEIAKQIWREAELAGMRLS